MFLFFSVIFNTFFIILVAKEHTKVKLALAIPTGRPMKLVKEIIAIAPLVFSI